MATPDLTIYTQLPSGSYMKISDRSGPYVWTGAAMKLLDDISGVVTVNSTFNTAVILSAQTSAVGATWVAFAAQAATVLDLVNNTGTAIEYRRGGAGNSFAIPDGAARAIEAITDANQISIRRVDNNNAQVIVYAEALRDV